MHADTKQHRCAKCWMLTGVGALAWAGVLALVLVVARTPQLKKLDMFRDLFGQSLVIHVDLTVLVWFLAAVGMLWNLIAPQSKGWLYIPYLRGASFGFFFAGTVMMGLSIFFGGEPLKNNYIPMLLNPLFMLSLGVALTGIFLAALEVLYRVRWGEVVESPLHFGIWSGAWITLVALACFLLSAHGIGGRVEGEEYYELLFWGGGHVLQLLYVQAMMVAWLWLAMQLAPERRVPRRLFYALFGIGLAFTLMSPLSYLFYDSTSFEYKKFFTDQMKYGGGVAPTLMMFWLAPFLLRRPHPEQRALHVALCMSLLLFAMGGVFGVFINGPNVRIPAHYHGSIVGVTLALMGLAYYLLPRFGGREVAGWRMAFWQPLVYGTGQALHVSGLAYSGGYEVLRKTPGEVSDGARAAMGVMGLGGLLAIIGGILFVAVVIRSFSGRRCTQGA